MNLPTTSQRPESEAVVLTYVTAPTLEVAEHIAKIVVEERLVACANILPGMTSVYRWNGAVKHDSEVVLICKTVRTRTPELEARVRALHPYECPCFVVLSVEDGSTPFLDWVNEQTRR